MMLSHLTQNKQQAGSTKEKVDVMSTFFISDELAELAAASIDQS